MPITRRSFLAGSAAAFAASRLGFAQAAPSIDRQAVVKRHNPQVGKIDPFSALTVGNGNFAFTADVTGLQTFADDYKADFPLCTASHWGWHSSPLPAGVKISDYRFKNYDTHGRPVGYATDGKGQEPLFNWLRENPHRMHLGRLGFLLDGAAIRGGEISNIDQRLDLWTGVLESRFTLAGQSVRVITACHPDQDVLAVTIDSPLVAWGRLAVRLAFPYPSPQLDMADWKSVDRHQTKVALSDGRADFERTVDADHYAVAVKFSQGTLKQTAAHEFVVSGSGDSLAMVCRFTPTASSDELPTADAVQSGSAEGWSRFWSTGGAIDLAGSTDAGAGELERRVVLSQYNTAIHCCGPMPSAETGLLCNSWYGKFHLEMHWWHSVHFAVWNRFERLNNSLGFYQRIIQVGRDTAARQGYKGCRWPKMVGPAGRDSPSPVAPLLIWQQPHPIYYAELSYRAAPSRQTLEKWRDVVFESADFMASFAYLDPATGRYVLGPPLKTVSENTKETTTTNPTFELAYWRFGLTAAQKWRDRLGLAPDPAWADVLARLSPLPVQDGMYLMQEGMTDTYTHWNWEHPALLGACGMQPGIGVDPAIFAATVKKVFEVWQWDRAWGWDFPMAALAATRAGLPELAVKALLIDSPKNHYHPNGHNYQRPGLTAYLPGNGGLLSAVALMAAGEAPGFPTNGKWKVVSEQLSPML